MTGEFIPYGRHSIDSDDIAAVVDVLRGDWLTTGPAVEKFELALGQVAGAPAVAVSSGTAALHCAYAAAGVGRGSELVTSPLTFVATAAAAMQLGATVRFADVHDATLTLDPEAAEAACSDVTRAIVPVDFAGHPADLDGLRQVATTVKAILIEDAAHSLGARYRGRPVGSLADMTIFSFHPVKTITTGEGGAVAVAAKEYLEPCRRFRNHGLVRAQNAMREPDAGGWHQEVHALGLNHRMPDVLAALGTSQLRRLDAFVARRAELVARYRSLLGDAEGLRLPMAEPHVQPAWHLFAVRVLDGRRRAVFDHMRNAAIGVQVHYLPVHHHPVFQDLGYRRGTCPIAERAYQELLSLPLYPALSNSEQDRVVSELRTALGA